MTQDNLVFFLIVTTFGLAIAFGAYQWFRARKAKREHHHSVAERNEGADPPSAQSAAAPPLAPAVDRSARTQEIR